MTSVETNAPCPACGSTALTPFHQMKGIPALSCTIWDSVAEAKSCPGIGDGELYPESAITRTSADDGIPSHRTRLRGRRPE